MRARIVVGNRGQETKSGASSETDYSYLTGSFAERLRNCIQVQVSGETVRGLSGSG